MKTDFGKRYKKLGVQVPAVHAHPGQREGHPGGRLPHQQGSTFTSSVLHPNTLNLDPDLEFWPNLDPDSGLCCQFCKKKVKNSYREKQFSKKTHLFLNYKKVPIGPERIFLSIKLFCSRIYPNFSCVDPDSYSKYG